MRMPRCLAAALLCVLASGCTRLPAKGHPYALRADSDFRHIPVAQLDSRRRPSSGSCEEKILSSMCVVDPLPPGAPYDSPRPCLGSDSDYATAILALYAELPPLYQKMMCTLKALWIENQLDSIGYAGDVVQNGVSIGNAMGVRASFLASRAPFGTIYSWKEQKLYGSTLPEFSFDPQLPVFAASEGNIALRYFFLHELSHLYDYANRVSAYETVNSQDVYAAGSWGDLDWLMPEKPRPEWRMANYADKICFYSCPGPRVTLPPPYEFYGELSRSDLLTSYAGVNVLEDFAESSAFYFLRTYYHDDVSLLMQGKPLLNVTAHIDEPSFRDKKAYLDKFYSSSPRTDYPVNP